MLGAMAGTFNVTNPVVVQCASANDTALPVGESGLYGGRTYPGWTPYGGSQFQYTSAMYRTFAESTCATTQDLNEAAFYLCADPSACAGTVVDECLTFATDTPMDLATLGAPNAKKTAFISIAYQALVCRAGPVHVGCCTSSRSLVSRSWKGPREQWALNSRARLLGSRDHLPT